MTHYTPAVQVKEAPKKSPINKCLLINGALLLVVLVCVCVYANIPSPKPFVKMAEVNPALLHEQLSGAVDGFTLSLHKELTKSSSNVFYSPLSISTCLAMTLIGSKARTRDQLADVLKTSSMNNDEVTVAYNSVLQKFNNQSGLHTANMLYSSDQMQMQKTYSEKLTKHFLAKAKTVDFGGAAEAVRKEINDAVLKETNNKIKDLIPGGVLGPLTRLVLVNAIHFKGLWQNQFDAKQTENEPFFLSDGTSVNVPMMKQSAHFLHSWKEDLNARALCMQYKENNLTMVIVLPDEGVSLDAVEQKLGGADLSSLVFGGMRTEVSIKIPRFTIEYEVDLVDVLKKLGATDLVTQGASDLSGIAGNPGDLYVSNVIHKAFIEVNEEGAEAAAATGTIMMARAMIRPTPPFIANRPFLFYLYDMDSRMTLFAGRYMQPPKPKGKQEL